MSTPTCELPLHATAENCSRRTFIVTGANTGLGYEATKHLVAAGAARVIMGVRNVDSGELAKAKIEAELGVTSVAEVWPIDLASYASVKSFATRAGAELDRIDALIENAGVYDFQRILYEGHLSVVTVNIMSTFLLAVLLLPKLSHTARQLGVTPHITVVGSNYGFYFQEAWISIRDDPIVRMDAEEKNLQPIYPLSKTMDILVARQLALIAPVSRTGVVVNVLTPGLCKTGLDRNGPPEFRASIAAQAAQFGRTAEEGSRTLLHGAFAGKESHGHYLDSCEIADDKLPDWITDEQGKVAEQRAWEVVAAELEAIEPGCLKKILELHE